MKLAFTLLAFISSVVTALVTCVQLFYLESLRIHTRERKSLEFFKQTLESELGLETERGALTFSVVKHLGLGVIGTLALAATVQDAPTWQEVLVACLLVSFFTVTGTYIVPQIVYRHRNNNTDTPLPPEEPAGKNPPDGAIIDCWLRDDLSSPVSIEITKGQHQLIRRFSSLDPPETINPKDFNVPMYWVRPPQTLATTKGMHRFIWDLTYPPPEVLSRDFPISAIYHDTALFPHGATVAPGIYTVTLTIESRLDVKDGKMPTFAQSFEVRKDPRLKISLTDLDSQLNLDRKIADALHRDYEAIQQIRSLRAQLKPLANNKSEAIAKASAALETKLAALEGKEGGYGSTYLSTPEGRSLAHLNSAFNALLTALDTADAAPTTQQEAMFGELDKALAEQLSAWAQVKERDIPELNHQLKKAGYPAPDPLKPVPAAANAAQSTERERN